MSEIRAHFHVSIKDYLLIDNCLGFAFSLIDLKSKTGNGKLSRRDKYYIKWILSVMGNLEEQVAKSTSDVDQKLLNKEIEMHTEFRADFGKVMGDAQGTFINSYLDGGN